MITCRCDVCGKGINKSSLFSDRFMTFRKGEIVELCNRCTKNLFKWLDNNIEEGEDADSN